MNIEAITHILKRCIQLLKKNGTTKVKNEYYYWIDWLKKQLKNYNKLDIKEKEIIKKICKINKSLYEDLEKFIKQKIFKKIKEHGRLGGGARFPPVHIII